MRGHLASDGEDAGAESGHEVADVRVGTVDDVLGCDVALRGRDDERPGRGPFDAGGRGEGVDTEVLIGACEI